MREERLRKEEYVTNRARRSGTNDENQLGGKEYLPSASSVQQPLLHFREVSQPNPHRSCLKQPKKSETLRMSMARQSVRGPPSPKGGAKGTGPFEKILRDGIGGINQSRSDKKSFYPYPRDRRASATYGDSHCEFLEIC